MPGKSSTRVARGLHQRYGVIMSNARIRKKMIARLGKGTRMSKWASVSAAAMVDAWLQLWFREAGVHIKTVTRNGAEVVPTIKPIHLAKGTASKDSVLHNVLPARVAGVYIPQEEH